MDFFWLFGGTTSLSNTNNPVIYVLNDLWNYDTFANVWRYAGGSENPPGSIQYPASIGGFGTVGPRSGMAYFSGPGSKLWIFGGFDGNNVNNDLWLLNN